jgi:hypothetical protein
LNPPFEKKIDRHTAASDLLISPIFIPFASKLIFCYENHTSGAAGRERPV